MSPENGGQKRLLLCILCILSSIILTTGVLFALSHRPMSVPAEGTQSAISNEYDAQEPSREFTPPSSDDPPQFIEDTNLSDPSDSAPAFQEYDITLMAVGDNLMHMGIVKTGKQEDGSYNFDFLFRNITDFLQYCDIKIINQETILGGNRLGFSGFPKFNSPTEVGDAIAGAGFNVVLHASNHAADQGLTGITNCLTFWDTYPELLAVGIHREASDDSLPLLSVGEKTFAILNYTYGPNLEVVPKDIRGHLDLLCAMDEASGALDFTTLNPEVLSDIERAKEAADVVIVCPHWGTEYSTTPSSYQRKWAEQMTQAGADLIIGTHPHVPQPVEWITSENGNTALCYYSLGNYVSTQKQTTAMLEGMAAVTFTVTEDGILINPAKTGVIPMVCHYTSGPVRLENVYLLEDYTEKQAASHGIRSYGGVTLHLDDLRKKSEDIFGEMVVTKQAFLPEKIDQSQPFSDKEAN
ncbi:MAG: CapA family protein [Acetatifactor sp.]